MGNVTPFVAQQQAAPYSLTPDEITKILAARKHEQAELKRRERYYEGEYDVRGGGSQQAVTEGGITKIIDVGVVKRTNPDGTKKTSVIDNKIAEMVDRHIGYALTNGVNIEPRGEDKAITKPMQEFYNAVAEANDLDSVNAELYRDCFVGNFGIEIHSFDARRQGAERIRITHTPAREWTLVWDTMGILRAAIREYCIGPWMFKDGKLISHQDRVTVYTDSTITNYVREGEGVLEIDGNPIMHQYGRIPIAWFSITEDFEDYITDAMISLQQHFNELLSDNGNSISQSSGALMIVKGYANDQGNIEAAQSAKEKGVMLVASDGDVTTLQVGAPKDSVAWQYEQIRAALYDAGKMTDTAHMVNATGATSGVALELLSTPQRDFAKVALQYFAEGIRRRIDLINAVQSKFQGEGFPIITNYEVKIKPSAAKNTQEIVAALPAMATTLSTLDRTRQLDFIQDPDEAVARYEKEKAGETMNQSAANSLANPVQAQDAQNATIAANVPTVAQHVQEALDAIVGAANKAVVKSGRVAANGNTANS